MSLRPCCFLDVFYEGRPGISELPGWWLVDTRFYLWLEMACPTTEVFGLDERSLCCAKFWSRAFEGDFLLRRRLPFVAVQVKFWRL